MVRSIAALLVITVLAVPVFGQATTRTVTEGTCQPEYQARSHGERIPSQVNGLIVDVPAEPETPITLILTQENLDALMSALRAVDDSGASPVVVVQVSPIPARQMLTALSLALGRPPEQTTLTSNRAVPKE